MLGPGRQPWVAWEAMSCGPPEWQRVVDPADVATLAVPAVQVGDIRADEDSISFTVDRPGSPVLVKTSLKTSLRPGP